METTALNNQLLTLNLSTLNLFDNSAAAYGRASTDKQDQSIAAQGEKLTSYAVANSLILDDDSLFLEDDVSGGIPFAERPGGRALLVQFKAGRYRHLIVPTIDRLGRNALDVQKWILHMQTCRQAGLSWQAIARDLSQPPMTTPDLFELVQQQSCPDPDAAAQPECLTQRAARNTPHTHAEAMQALKALEHFIGPHQLRVLRDCCRGEEKQYFFDLLCE